MNTYNTQFIHKSKYRVVNFFMFQQFIHWILLSAIKWTGLSEEHRELSDKIMSYCTSLYTQWENDWGASGESWAGKQVIHSQEALSALPLPGFLIAISVTFIRGFCWRPHRAAWATSAEASFLLWAKCVCYFYLLEWTNADCLWLCH